VLPNTVLAVRVTTRPTFALGKPVQVPDGGQLSGIAPNAPRRYDMAPDGRLLGLAAAGQPESSAPEEIRVVLNWFEELRERAPTK